MIEKISSRVVALLHQLAGDGRAHLDVLEVEILDRGDRRPHRREGVEALAQGELAQRRLQLGAPPGDVVECRDPADRLARVGAVGAVGAPADHDGDLALPVGAGLLAWDHDRRSGADQRRGELREHHRNLGYREVGLLGVGAVVEADRDDLAGVDRVQQRQLGKRAFRAARRCEARPALRGGDEARGGRRAGVAHQLPLQGAEVRRSVGTLESNCLHAASSWIDRSTFIALIARGTPA